MPTTMLAAVVVRHGGPEALELREVPVPEPGPGEVRLRVGAAALNRADLGLLRGLSGPGLRPKRLPMVPGVDVAGTVDARGAGVPAAAWPDGTPAVAYPGLFCGVCEGCAAGEESMCDHYQILGEERDGGFAEYVVVPARNLLQVPVHVPLTVAAAAPAAFGTAWRMLVTCGGLTMGQTLLVVGVGSGVSTAAVALARHAGARVLATTRVEAKAELARRMGVEAVRVGYEEPFDAWALERTGGRGVDLVADSVGAATWCASIRSLRWGGALVVCGASSGDDPSFSIRELYQRHRRILGAPLGNRRDFQRALSVVFAGGAAPVIDSVHPLGRIHDAFERLASGAQFGKIVVVPGGG